jgi:uncharacterized protein YbjQ (UPF0145 family)
VLLTTSDNIPGKKNTVLGLVEGSVVISRNALLNIVTSWDNSLGGEINGYAKLLNDSRKVATERMTDEARQLKAGGIVAIKYQMSEVLQGAVEILVYGTAVNLT